MATVVWAVLLSLTLGLALVSFARPITLRGLVIVERTLTICLVVAVLLFVVVYYTAT